MQAFVCLAHLVWHVPQAASKVHWEIVSAPLVLTANISHYQANLPVLTAQLTRTAHQRPRFNVTRVLGCLAHLVWRVLQVVSKALLEIVSAPLVLTANISLYLEDLLA
jgi:hypothetical protein